MWEFNNPSKPIRCGCDSTPDELKRLESYRRYVLASLEGYYNKISEELANTNPAGLAELNKAIAEYKEIENSIDAKMQELDEIVTSFISSYGEDPTENIQLVANYDPLNKNFSYSLQRRK